MSHIHTYPAFTKEMKATHEILIPNMLPAQFRLLERALNVHGYRVKLLTNGGQAVVDAGLKSVHNDFCYPALLVIGQMLDALDSGEYDLNRVALMITQTGGGCRASNYIFMLRKALIERGWGHIPVLSLNFSGLDSKYSLKTTPAVMQKLAWSVLLGDLIMLCYNQTRPYELTPGAAEAARERALNAAFDAIGTRAKMVRHAKLKRAYAEILRIFGEVKRSPRNKVRVGIVGEIYVKYSPLGNNGLEDFLLASGAEPVVPGLLDFCMYCVVNSLLDRKIYGGRRFRSVIWKVVYNYFVKKQRALIAAVENHGAFAAPAPFERTLREVEGYISPAVKMGEGWLLTAEMVELIHSGVPSIVCTQPFGCLPNHIAGKGMIRRIKEANPGANIVAVDYDPGATKVNQENRIKLMLALADKPGDAAGSPQHGDAAVREYVAVK